MTGSEENGSTGYVIYYIRFKNNYPYMVSIFIGKSFKSNIYCRKLNILSVKILQRYFYGMIVAVIAYDVLCIHACNL